jgi:hypothetical protein
VIGQLFIEGVAEVPAVGEIQRGGRLELVLGAEPLKEHDQLPREEDDRIDARLSSIGIELSCPVADEIEVERRLQMPIEVVCGDEVLA